MTKKELAQSELFKTDTTWFHMFKEIIRNGTWARLSSNSKSLYPVIKAYINWESGAAFPSIDTLQEYSGLARASVIKALKELEAEGLLIKQTTAGRHSNYTLVEKFDVKEVRADQQHQSALIIYLAM
jgi:biotin operon repressor